MAKAATALVLSIPILLGGVAVGLYAVSTHSSLAFDPPPAVIGTATPVSVRIANPHGVRASAARIEQDGQQHHVDQVNRPASRFTFWRTHAAARDFHFIAGKDRAPQLKEGKARLIVEAQSNDLRAVTDTIAADVDVVLRPPSVTSGWISALHQPGRFGVRAAHSLRIVARGGRARRTGHVPQFPGAGRAQQRVSLFAYSWDTPTDTAPVVFASNGAGTEATARFWFKVFPKKFRSRDLSIDDAFLEKVVNQIDPDGSGDLLTRVLEDQRRDAARE